MTLKEFRKLFVNTTGRYDLVEDTESYADAGADFYIKAGIRYLDSSFSVGHEDPKYRLDLEKDKSDYSLPGVLSVKEVAVVTPDSGQVMLTKLENWEIDQLLQDADGSGIPCNYSVSSDIRNPLLGNSEQTYQEPVLKVYPAPNADMTLFLSGRFASPLSDDSQTCFWFNVYPDLAVSAGQYKIEVHHRNTQGANDHLRAIQLMMREIEHDLIESEMGDLNQMRDSFKFRGQGNAR